MSREAMQLALEALEDANDVARMEFSDEDCINRFRVVIFIYTTKRRGLVSRSAMIGQQEKKDAA